MPPVILPGRNRKGNLLTVLLVLFVSGTASIIDFTSGLPASRRTDFLARCRHFLRKPVLLTGILLFLASSLEWTNNASAPVSSPLPLITAIQTRETSLATMARPDIITASCLHLSPAPAAYLLTIRLPGKLYCSLPGLFILHGHLRI